MEPTVVKTVSIAAIFILVLVVLPVVVLLLEHQRKMVRLMRGEPVQETPSQLGIIMTGGKGSEQTEALAERVSALELEVSELRRALSMPERPQTEAIRELLA